MMSEGSCPNDGEGGGGGTSQWLQTVAVLLPQLFQPLTAYLLVISFTLYGLYKIYLVPYERKFMQFEFGYSDIKKKELINSMIKARKTGDVPPPYPNGWYAIAETKDIPKMTAHEITCLGTNVVLWRGETGKCYVADTYCPHLGASLGVGGTVHGDCIECPMHAWTFDGSTGGKLVKILSGKPPDFVKLKMWQTMEANGHIYIWYHSKDESPTWYPDHIFDSLSPGPWRYIGAAQYYCSMHIQEIFENTADLVHFQKVHVPSIFAGSKPKKSWFNWSFFTSVWDMDWIVADGEPHVGINVIKSGVKLFGKSFWIPVDDARLIGPTLLNVPLRTPLGEALLQTTILPVEPHLQRFTQTLWATSLAVRPLAKLMLWGDCIQFERDIEIFNRKQFLSRPILSGGDKRIKLFRKWFSQFYTEDEENTDKKSSFYKEETVADFCKSCEE